MITKAETVQPLVTIDPIPLLVVDVFATILLVCIAAYQVNKEKHKK